MQQRLRTDIRARLRDEHRMENAARKAPVRLPPIPQQGVRRLEAVIAAGEAEIGEANA